MHGLTPEEEIDYWRERARRAEADAKLGNEIAAKVNDAINRAGIHCALYYWEAIDQIAKERDEARAEVKRYRSQLEELTWIANGLKAAGAWKPSEVWREEVADEVAEQIATWLNERAKQLRASGNPYRPAENEHWDQMADAADDFAADIRAEFGGKEQGK